MRKRCYLREAQERDRELLFRWANDAETRSRSFSQAPITWEEHTAWFARIQADVNSLHWILMAPEEESGKTVREPERGAVRPAGTLRVTKDGDGGAYRVSYSVAPECRGHGFGTAILELAKSWAAAFCPACQYLYGEVKADNAASVRCFEKAGYGKAECHKEEFDIADGEEAVDQEMGNGGAAAEKHVDTVRKVLRFYADLTRELILYFRVDAGAQIGSGHLMRCFTIADACRARGLLPVFVTADAGAEATVLGRGYPCLVLNADYRNMDSETERLLPLLRCGAPVVLDSYFLTRQYVETLKGNGHPVAWLDDFLEQQYPVDLLINYNLYAGRREGEAEFGNDPSVSSSCGERGQGSCIRLLGTSYAPVRPSFVRKATTVGERIHRVLVTAGGSDPYGAGVLFARLMKILLPEAERLVVCGPYALEKDTLYALSEQDPNLKVIEGCNDLSGVMRRCDLAVAAAGSTLYELCASGLPCIVYYMADNQRMGAEAFERETGAVNLGDIRADGFQTSAQRKLEAALVRLAEVSERQRLADAMHALVDGQGADRIAEKLGELAEASAALVFRGSR